MNVKTLTLKCLAVFALSFASLAQANTYYLNYSNTFGDTGVDYAQVDVTETGGNLLFNVQSLNPTGWWFDKFYFNLGGSTGAITLTGLPSGWSADTDQNVSMFGIFSDGATGTGNSNYSSFSFTADGTNTLSLANLMANAEGWTFAAHQKCGGKNHPQCSALGDGVTSHFIADTPSEVPVPGAAWLFGSALLGMVGFRRKKA